MADQRHERASRPKSIEEIVKEAKDFDHVSQYPFRIANRTAQNILNQAINYSREGDLQQAYLFLYRHAEFCMTKIATHPDRKKPENKDALTRVTKEVQADLAKLEDLKPELNKRYERYRESWKRIEAAREKERKAKQKGGTSDQYRRRTSRDATVDGHSPDGQQLLHAGDHADIALKLAHRELERRGVRSRRGQDATTYAQEDFDELTRGIRNLGRRLERPEKEAHQPQPSTSTTYRYPAVFSPHNVDHTPTGTYPPQIPRKEPYLTQAHSGVQVAPLLPAKPDVQNPAVPALPPKDEVSSSQYSFKALASNEAGVPLRPVFLPTELRPDFLSIAASNTGRNLETCGVLCASLISGALFISHLVIPEQTNTSDTCDTTDEGDNALFDYVDGEQLMVCGWIHTHPTQTCFLSSRDLHTSVGYQIMLPESIAIVCAPKHSPDHGIFRLTDPPGKQAILDCHQSGLFHPHAQTNLYTDALRPGHVSELKGLQFQVVDLRKK